MDSANFSTYVIQVVGHEKSVIQCASDRCVASGIPFFRICPVGIDVRIDQVSSNHFLFLLDKTLGRRRQTHANDLGLISPFIQQLQSH